MIPAPPFNTFSLGPLTVHLYGISIALALVTCYTLALKIAKKNAIEEKEFDKYFFISIAFAFIGARIYHLSTNWWYYQDHLVETIMIWNGGLGIYGGILGAVLTLYILTKRTTRSFFSIADIFAIVLPLGQAIGRWGNYFNQELFGYPTSLPWALQVEEQFRPEHFKQSNTFHPTFLYESLLNFINFAVLYLLYTKKKLKPGTVTAVYLINYGIIRFVVDIFKIDPDARIQAGFLTVSQWVSLIVVIVGICLLVAINKTNLSRNNPAN